MGVFEAPSNVTGHEQVVFCQDKESGLKAIIAIYSTALGPALGGTRFYAYANEDDAVYDALDLSKGMAYKNALAGLDLGGGKAVIWGDPATDKSEPLLRAYGRFIETLGGRYITACDVGTYVQDMDVIAKETSFVTGRSSDHGGAGDSSVLTAWGVVCGMRAALQHRFETTSFAGRTVGIAGIGKVGRYLVPHMIEEGAEVVATDIAPQAKKWLAENYPQVTFVDSTQELITSNIDIYAPCALGGALDDDTVAQLRASIVVGSANNQLAHPGVEKLLQDRGILYAPDYLVNSGGVIQVSDEIEGFNFDRAKRRASQIFDITQTILRTADAENVSPAVAADALAERRIADCGRIRTIYLGKN